MTIRLKNFQKPHVESVVSLIREEGIFIDCSSTGAGKTITSLFAAKRLGMRPFIVCTKSVLEYWQEWAEAIGVPLEGVANYEAILAATAVTEHYEALDEDGNTVTKRRRRFTNLKYHPKASELVGGWEFVNRQWRWNLDPNEVMLIFDEAHKLGGKSSKVSHFLKGAADQDFDMLLLSATLIDSPLRMRALAYALKLFKGWSSVKFNAWCMLHGCDLGDVGKLVFDGDQEYIEQIKEDIGDRMGGIDTKDIPDFPDSNIILLSVPYKGPDLDNAYSKELAELEIEAETEAVACLRARQQSEWGKRQWILDRAKENEAEGLSVVIFTSFVPTGEWLSEKLKCPFIAGKTKKTRHADIKRFQANEVHFIVVMTDAGGESISLHDLHGRPRVVYCSPNHNGTVFKQVLGRTPRTGSQQSKVNQYILFARGSAVEARIRYNLRKKTQTIETISGNDLNVMPPKMIKAEEISCSNSPTSEELGMATHQCANCRINTALGEEIDGDIYCTTCASELFEGDFSGIYCPSCFNEIDPDICHCGNPREGHGYHDNHSFVPAGCTCGYHDSEKRKGTPKILCEGCCRIMPEGEEEYSHCAKCDAELD